MYGFIRELLRFEAQVSRRLGSFLTMRQVRILADPDAALNLVPIDDVVRQAVAVSQAGCQAPVIHLTNATPATVGAVLTVLFRRLGLRAPTFVDSSDHFSSIDAEFDKGINFYGSYLAGHKEFDQRAAAAIGTISSDVGDESMLVLVHPESTRASAFLLVLLAVMKISSSIWCCPDDRTHPVGSLRCSRGISGILVSCFFNPVNTLFVNPGCVATTPWGCQKTVLPSSLRRLP